MLLSLSVPVAAPVDPLALLDRSSAASAFFWERPVDDFALAGVGTAAVVEGRGAGRFSAVAGECERLLESAVIDDAPYGPIFAGGFAFADEPPPNGLWRGFPAGRLIVPRLAVVRRGRAAALTASASVEPASAAADVVARLVEDLTSAAMSGGDGRDLPEEAGGAVETIEATAPEVWKKTVAAAVDDIRRGRFEKVVLARAATVRAPAALDCEGIVRRLRGVYPTCAIFWVRTDAGSFIGASPEPLVRLEGREVRTAAVAGTIGRGNSPGQDGSLGRALAASAKERREHNTVVEAIETALAPLCERLVVASEPELMRLENVQHLVTPIAGRLAAPRGILDIVASLHPSPAVAGYPRDAALAVLSGCEAFDRGWYAGPLGWMDARRNGEFAVAIRSALVRGREATLFAGAGIVAASDPDAELAETELKLHALRAALTFALRPPQS